MLLVKVAPVGDSEGLVGGGVVNRTPHIDDTHASFQQTFGVISEVAADASDGGRVALVDVDALLEGSNELCFIHWIIENVQQDHG